MRCAKPVSRSELWLSLVGLLGLLVLAPTLMGCIPIRVERTFFFSPDASGSVSYLIRLPNSGAGAQAAQELRKRTPPFFQGTDLSGQGSEIHYSARFEFSGPEDLNEKLRNLGDLRFSDETVTAAMEDRGEPLKRAFVFNHYVSPLEGRDRSMDGYVTIQDKVYLPGFVTTTNSTESESNVWTFRTDQGLIQQAETRLSNAVHMEVFLVFGRYGQVEVWGEVGYPTRLLDEEPWVAQDWDRVMGTIQARFPALSPQRTDLEVPTRGEGRAPARGLRMHGCFRDLQAVVKECRLDQGLLPVRVTRDRQGSPFHFRDRYRLEFANVKGTPLEDLLYSFWIYLPEGGPATTVEESPAVHTDPQQDPTRFYRASVDVSTRDEPAVVELTFERDNAELVAATWASLVSLVALLVSLRIWRRKSAMAGASHEGTLEWAGQATQPGYTEAEDLEALWQEAGAAPPGEDLEALWDQTGHGAAGEDLEALWDQADQDPQALWEATEPGPAVEASPAAPTTSPPRVTPVPPQDIPEL
jgi:hypothetical protein